MQAKQRNQYRVGRKYKRECLLYKGICLALMPENIKLSQKEYEMLHFRYAKRYTPYKGSGVAYLPLSVELVKSILGMD